MKKIENNLFTKWFPLCAVLLASFAALAVFLITFLPAIHVPADPSFANDDGFRAGWNVMFYGPGMQIIYGKHEFSTNVLLIVAMVLPVLTSIVAGIMWRKSGRVRRIVLALITASVLIFAAVVFLNICPIAKTTASLGDSSYEMSREIDKAPQQYYAGGFTVFAAVLALIAGIAQIGNAVVNFLTSEQSAQN